MSIQWNKEVKMKDVKKFLNQEISLGEIDYHKCLQVSLMVVAFGIIPAFTYGTVLGTLEGQRIALMGEVSSLKAAVLSATNELNVISELKTSKASYGANEPVTVSFNLALDPKIATTSNQYIDFRLFDVKGKLIRSLLFTNNIKPGLNTISLNVVVPATSTETVYFIKSTYFLSGGVAISNSFQISKQSTAMSFDARLNLASPVERTITTSNSIVTKDVVLGVLDIKPYGTNRVLDRVTVLFTDNAPIGTNQYYRNIRLIGANKTYTPDKVNKGYAVFTDVSVSSEWSQFILKTDVAPQSEFKNGTVASTTFVVDQTKIVASKVFFLQKGGSVTNTSASYSLIDNGSNAINAATVNMKFTFNNTGDSDLYVDNTTALSLATSSTITTTAASKMSLAQFTPVPATIAGDTRFAYAIPAGTSRVFTVSGSMRNRTGVQGVQEFKITKIFYSDTLTNLKKSYIDFGLENLRVTPTI